MNDVPIDLEMIRRERDGIWAAAVAALKFWSNVSSLKLAKWITALKCESRQF